MCSYFIGKPKTILFEMQHAPSYYLYAVITIDIALHGLPDTLEFLTTQFSLGDPKFANLTFP